MTAAADWVIWNGSMGILDMVAIGRVDGGEAFLAEPYDVVGPFRLDELEAQGRIAFGECLVMSRQRWQEDQTGLRMAAREKRRAQLMHATFADSESEHRGTLDLPEEGILDAAQINAAFRRLAKTAHPDAGGSSTHYHRISEARDTLLERLGMAV
ncbi:J domain-containing protein [Novosphingobium beihaiensis]|uniref:J domain-containing protein n=1 Tax=Novosphingobium beihaiensis TaxID=2930389 RepID=A0ABT0BSC8_9SPHN|nr:J domain-containing protein [Novosphingobium beihaiensis]MCJ2187954.1 J domain-containing protein [Novosphingobium beihaiensis]